VSLRRSATRIAIIAGFSAALVVALILGAVLWPVGALRRPARPRDVDLIAHAGLHQATSVDARDECSARLSGPFRHRFLDNTVPAVGEAFRLGATVVELDVHPTADGSLAVFHDWTLDCRTNGTGVTHEQRLAYLKGLDVGYGYTADSGRTFPLRGTGVGLMPTLPEVFRAFPGRAFLVNQKDQFARTADLLARAVDSLPEDARGRIYYWGPPKPYETLRQRTSSVRRMLPTVAEERRCATRVALTVALGPLPGACRNIGGVGIPARYIAARFGWRAWVERRLTLRFLRQAVLAGEPVYVVNVDDATALRAALALPVSGIMTDRIDVTGPLFAEMRAGPAPR
jgi:glycerophosphoryl diester phosphodiesterase